LAASGPRQLLTLFVLLLSVTHPALSFLIMAVHYTRALRILYRNTGRAHGRGRLLTTMVRSGLLLPLTFLVSVVGTHALITRHNLTSLPSQPDLTAVRPQTARWRQSWRVSPPATR
jgi:hypothetical protein